MLGALSPEEAQRYKAMIRENEILSYMLDTLGSLTSQLHVEILEQELLLTRRCHLDLVGSSVTLFSPASVLQEEYLTAFYGAPKGEGMLKSINVTLALRKQRITVLAGDAKAVFNYIVDVAGKLGIEPMIANAHSAIWGFESHTHDTTSTSPTAASGTDTEQVASEAADDLLDNEWLLDWEAVEENPDTAKRVRLDPKHFVPVSFDRDEQDLKEHYPDLVKKVMHNSGVSR